MGQAKQKPTSTQRMINAHPYCALCGGVRPTETREHFPPTNFFDCFHRPERFVVPACNPCNRESAIADLLAGILSRIGFDEPTAQEAEDTSKLVKKLGKLRPDLATKMFSVGPVARKRAFRRYREQGLDAPGEYKAIAISGEMFQYLNLFAHKAVLCHYFNTTKQPLPRQERRTKFPEAKGTGRNGRSASRIVEPSRPRHGNLTGQARAQRI
jgi:hypothetical protein